MLVFREVYPDAAQDESPMGLLAQLRVAGIPVAVLREDGIVLINGPATEGWEALRWEDRTPQ